MVKDKEESGGAKKAAGPPPVGFGYTGKFGDLPEAHQVLLQKQWDALTVKEQEEVSGRTEHLRYNPDDYHPTGQRKLPQGFILER